MLKIGDRIPDLETDAYMDGEFKKVKLSDFQGKWLVMAFYPADFTFVCPTELEELANKYPEFKEAGAEIVSISTDTHFTHLAWHESSPAIGKVEYPMLADPSMKICREFGTLIEDGIEDVGLSRRGTFIIDPKGVLKYMSIHDNSMGRSAAEILRMVKAAKYVSEHDGEVCPASWEPGKETLKPGLKLVGKL